MFGRDQIDIRLRNKQGDRFLLTHQRFHSLHKERLSFRSTRRDAWNFLFDLQLGQFNELEEKLKDHPLLKNPHHTGYKSTRRLIEDALNWGSLNVFVIHRDQSRNLKQIETLYDRIKMKLGMIIASEKAEAAVIDQQYQALDSGGKIQAHAHRFGQGLKQAGHSLLTWLGEVHDVVSKVKQRGRVYEAYLKTQTHDSVIDWYKEFNEHWREAEYKEIVDVLGFDPKKISSEDFSQAWAMSQILWEDERCQTLLTQFARDYSKAQHSLEISELVGSAAFEILLTLVLAAVTAGTGAIVNLASKARLARQMTDLGESLKELADLKKVVNQHSPKKTHHTRASGDMIKDLPVDDRPAPKSSPPPKGEISSEPSQSDRKEQKKSKKVLPNSLDETINILKKRRKQIAESGYQPKYSDADLARMVQQDNIANERFQVRFMEQGYLQDRNTPDIPLSGKMGQVMKGTNGEGAKYWSTSFDQLEDADSDPKLISEKLGLEYDARKDYALVIVDSEKANPLTGVKSVPATFDNLSKFANTELPDDFPENFTEQVMNPAFQAKYAQHYNAAVESGALPNAWSRNTKAFGKYLRTTDLSNEEQKLLRTRMKMHDKIGNNQDYMGNGLTKDINPESSNTYGAVETLNFERRIVNLKQLDDADAITILEELKPI